MTKKLSLPVLLLSHLKEKRGVPPIERKCEICSKTFRVYPYRLRLKQARFCGNKCRGVWLQGKRISPATEIKRGQHFSRRTEFKKGHGMNRDEQNPQWNGDDVGYHALHNWIRRKMGNAKQCMNCHAKNAKYAWANISQDYKRDLSDWIELCYLCHKRYDLGRIDISTPNETIPRRLIA